MRHGFIKENPIRLVRQGSKRSKVPEILELEEIRALLAAVRLRERSMILMDLGAGLRRGELFGLISSTARLAADSDRQTCRPPRRPVIRRSVHAHDKLGLSKWRVPNSYCAGIIGWFRESPKCGCQERHQGSNRGSFHHSDSKTVQRHHVTFELVRSPIHSQVDVGLRYEIGSVMACLQQ